MAKIYDRQTQFVTVNCLGNKIHILQGSMVACYSNLFFNWCWQDVLKFGFSTREYVVLTEKSQDVEDEDDEDGTQS